MDDKNSLSHTKWNCDAVKIELKILTTFFHCTISQYTDTQLILAE